MSGITLYGASLAARIRVSWRARPRLLAAAVLSTVPLVAILALGSEEIWYSPHTEADARVSEGVAVVFSGDILSGEGIALVSDMASLVEVRASWLDSDAPDGVFLSAGRPEVRRGVVVTAETVEDYAFVERTALAVARAYPSISVLDVFPWSYEPSPTALPWRAARGLPFLPVAAALLLILYPVLESYSRFLHILRAAFLTLVVILSAGVATVAGIVASGWAVRMGSGHDVLAVVPAAFSAAIASAIIPVFWSSGNETAGDLFPEVKAASRTALLVAPMALLTLASGYVLSVTSSSSAFGSAGLVLVAAGASSLVSSATASSVLVLTGMLPRSPSLSHSAFSGVLLSMAPAFSRILSRRLVVSVVAAALAVIGVLGVSPSQPPDLGTPTSVVIEFEADPDGQNAALFTSRALSENTLLRAFVLPERSPEQTTLILGETALRDPALTSSLEGSIAAGGARLLLAGGAYARWSSWSSSLPLAVISAALLLLASSVVALSVFAHSSFSFARSGMVMVAFSLPLFPVLLEDAASSSVRGLVLLAGVLPWVATFASEGARECDAGADGATACSSSLMLCIPLAVPPVLALVVYSPAMIVPILPALLSGLLLAISALMLLGHKESLRF